MSNRQCRFLRRADPPALVLTARDVEIVLACWEHRWLTRGQLQTVIGMPCIARINQRLRQLYDHQFLERLRAGTVGVGLQPVYLAGRSSVPLIVSRTEHSPTAIRERMREDVRASAVLLPHDLEVNDVRIALVSALRQHSQVGLDLWRNAAESYDAYTSERSLRPDGYLRFWRDRTLHAFFLEVDRGTTSLARWQAKVARYLEYRESGGYTRKHGLTRFRVLTTVPSLARLEHLRAATRELTERSFWFTLTSTVVADADPERPIWQPVGGTSSRALIAP